MKKILVVGLSVILICALVLAGCSTEPSDPSTEGKAFVVGGTGPLTGDASSYGISVKQGAELAVEEINGKNGIKFEFIMKDDKAAEADAAVGYDQLMDAGMQVSIGAVTSGSCESFAAKSVEDNLFFITPSASRADLISERDNGFRICFGDPDQGILAAHTLVDDYGKKTIGCIYDTSDTYSSGIYEAFDSEMKTMGVAYTTKTFDKENNKDFSTQVEALKDCDVIFLPIYYTEAGLIARECTKKGVNCLIFGCDGLDGVVDQVDATVVNEIQYITPFDVKSTDAKVSAFVKAYTKKYDKEPDQFAADGYDAIYSIYEAMQKAGVTDTSISASDLCEKLKAAYTTDFSFTGVTGQMTWSKDGAPTKAPIIVTVSK